MFHIGAPMEFSACSLIHNSFRLEALANYRSFMEEHYGKKTSHGEEISPSRLKHRILAPVHALIILFKTTIYQLIRGLTLLLDGAMSLDRERLKFACIDLISIPLQTIALVYVVANTIIDPEKALWLAGDIETKFNNYKSNSFFPDIPEVTLNINSSSVANRVAFIATTLLETFVGILVTVINAIPESLNFVVLGEFEGALHSLFNFLHNNLSNNLYYIKKAFDGPCEIVLLPLNFKVIPIEIAPRETESSPLDSKSD